MATNNIFSDQDFEKIPNEKKSKKPLIYGGIVAGLIAVSAIGYGVWGNGGDEVNPPGPMLSDTTMTAPKVDSAEVKTYVEESPVVEEPNLEIESKPMQPSPDVQKPSASVEEVKAAAISVIRGNYGNNPERRRKLGERYQEIQSKVNEMYRNGEVR